MVERRRVAPASAQGVSGVFSGLWDGVRGGTCRPWSESGYQWSISRFRIPGLNSQLYTFSPFLTVFCDDGSG